MHYIFGVPRSQHNGPFGVPRSQQSGPLFFSVHFKVARAKEKKNKASRVRGMMQAVGSLLSGWASQLLSTVPMGTVPPDSNSTLDPLSTLIRIHTLAFRPTGTKICIENNALCFHSPAFGQGALRFRKGVSRNDIHVLKHTIQKAVAWYNLKHPQIRFLAQGAIKGLEKFAQCYNQTSNLAAHSIAYYILIIRTELHAPSQPLVPADQAARRAAGSAPSVPSHEQKSRKPGYHLEDEDDDRPATVTSTTNLNSGMRRVTSSSNAASSVHGSANANVNVNANILRDGAATEQDAVATRLQQLWTSQQINIVHAIMLELEAQNGDEHRVEVDSLIGSIENILRSKDKRVCEMVQILEQSKAQTTANRADGAP